MLKLFQDKDRCFFLFNFKNDHLYHVRPLNSKTFLSHLTKKGSINPLNPNLTKWSETLKQFVGKLPTNCLSVFDHFVGLAFKGLISCLNFAAKV